MDTKRQLARAVLAEIPDQLISYMRLKGYKPQNIGRKQSLLQRQSQSSVKKKTSDKMENSTNYKRSDHNVPQASSPSAPPYLFNWP